MNSPRQTAAPTAQEIDALNKQLSIMRHDINNHLSLMMAAIELIRRKPEAIERMSNTLVGQPEKITEAMKKFSAEFETVLGIKRG
jgi:predicted  nucleic acid-binding Zn-ribbon protein